MVFLVVKSEADSLYNSNSKIDSIDAQTVV